ncbi:hypothetical protein A3Q56_04788, partial [Intoshia linei]
MSHTKLNILVQKCDELKLKITLLEGDSKSSYESSEWKQKNNRHNVKKLRDEYDELYSLRANKMMADSELVAKSLNDVPEEKKCFRNKSGLVALDLINNKHKYYVNQLNYLKFLTEKYKKNQNLLKSKHEEMQQENSEIKETKQDETAVSKDTRTLENKFEKSKLRYTEALHIFQAYVAIKQDMQQNNQTFDQQLDQLENSIKISEAEHDKQFKVNQQATCSRDIAITNLEKCEKEIHSARKEREMNISKVRKRAEEKKLQYTKRIGEPQILNDTNTGTMTLDDNDEFGISKISLYAQAITKIKQATGVTDTKEVVIRFENQGESKNRLENIKNENKENTTKLEEKCINLIQEFNQMRYSGNDKIVEAQIVLEEKRKEFSVIKFNLKEVNENLDMSLALLLSIKSGLNHLLDKLQPNANDLEKLKSRDSEKYSFQQLSLCDEKIDEIMLELKDDDINSTWNLLNQNEYISMIELGQPEYNTHIKLKIRKKENAF